MKSLFIKIAVMSPLVFSSMVMEAGASSASYPVFILSDVKPIAIHIVVKVSSMDQLSGEDLKELIRLAGVYRNAKFTNQHKGVVIDVIVDSGSESDSFNLVYPENMNVIYQQNSKVNSVGKSIQGFDKDGKVIFTLQSVNDLFNNINKQLSRV